MKCEGWFEDLGGDGSGVVVEERLMNFLNEDVEPTPPIVRDRLIHQERHHLHLLQR